MTEGSYGPFLIWVTKKGSNKGLPDLSGGSGNQNFFFNRLHTCWISFIRSCSAPILLPINRFIILQKFTTPMFSCIYAIKQRVHDLSLIHISEPTRRTPISYAVFCLKKK